MLFPFQNKIKSRTTSFLTGGGCHSQNLMVTNRRGAPGDTAVGTRSGSALAFSPRGSRLLPLQKPARAAWLGLHGHGGWFWYPGPGIPKASGPRCQNHIKGRFYSNSTVTVLGLLVNKSCGFHLRVKKQPCDLKQTFTL